VGNSNDLAHPLRLSNKIGMPQKAADEGSDFILSGTHPNQAVASRAEGPQIEIGIARKESRVAMPPQENNDIIIR